MRFLRSKAVFQILLLIVELIAFASFITEPTSADETQQVCCEKITTGDFCVFTDATQCDPDYSSAPNACADTSFCKPVCCVDRSEGTCSDNVGVADCTNSGDTLSFDSACSSVDICTQGCCQIGNQCLLTTQNNCDFLTQLNSDADRGDFSSSVTTERACLTQCQAADQGCCIALEGTCSFTSSAQCSTAGLENPEGTIGFYQGIFCTDSSLDCVCTAHFKKGCAPGEDEVYWFDSCGNREDVAEDCDYGQGTLCKQQGDDAFCASINCEDTSKGNRVHGESWCRYEGRVGPTNDLVGSRHYREICINGQVLVEPCADFRDELCAEYLLNDQGQQLLKSECIPNEGASCVQDCNDRDLSMAKRKQCCTEELSCYWAGSDSKGICIPLSPPGLAFWDDAEGSRTPRRNAKEICDMGDKKCTSVYVKKRIGGDYKCEANCECEDPGWANQMNTYCRSLGDCGAHYSVYGYFSDEGIHARGEHTHQFNPNLYEPFSTFWNLTENSLNFGDLSIAFNEDASYNYKPFFRVIRDGIATGTGDTWGKIITGILLILAAFFAGIFIVIILLDYITGGWLSRATQKLFGIGNKKKYDHYINCEPWVAPRGGSRCTQCQDDFGADCTEYKCKTYGNTCELVNEGTSEVACVDANPHDVTTPTISPWNDILTQGHSLEQTPHGYYIRADATPLVKPFTLLTFGIQTSEFAQCKYSETGGIPFEEMTTFFGTLSYSLNHNFTLFTTGSTDYSFHVKCSDKVGNANIQDYAIQFSTSAEPDLTPPTLVFTDPDHNTKVASGLGVVGATFFFTEPIQECRYSTDHAGIPFDSMDETTSDFFACADEPSAIDPIHHLFTCFSALAVADNTPNTFFIKCKDLAGNVNTQDTTYTLTGTVPLEISSARPSGTLYSRDVPLLVSTKNGAEQGKAVCRLSGPFISRELDFFATGGTQHSMTLRNLTLGDYEYHVRCTDVADNLAETDLSFSVDVDTYPPSLVAVYMQGGTTLVVVTDEPSSCRYSTTDDSFAFTQGSALTGDSLTEHLLQDSASVYYIACRDINQNEMSTFTVYR